MNQKITFIDPETGNLAVVHRLKNDPIEAVAARVVPEGVPYDVVDASAIPADKTFRNAWVGAPGGIDIDIPKAQALAHGMRRAKREEEFKPHDEVIARQIPGKVQQAENARAAIRAKYDQMQLDIDAAADVAGLKTVLGI